MNRAVFLDRDGVLNEEKEYLHRVEEFAFLPGSISALQQLAGAGFNLFIVTNQSGVGRGYFAIEDVNKLHEHILARLRQAGVTVTRIYCAFEAPDQPSRGRKPSPQFLFDARDEFGLDLSRSFMIGDKWSDLECGWNAGVQKSILVRTGYGARTEQEYSEKLQAATVVDDLKAGVKWILSQS